MDIALDLDIGDIIVKTAIGVLPHLDKSDKERDPITYTATDPDPDLEIKDIPDLVEKRIAQIPQTRSTTTLSASSSPTRQLPKGPDGTLFGSLPGYKVKAGLALGFGAHVLNTYRHIKAEHEAGYRTRSFIEKRMDEARRRKMGAEATDKNRRRRLDKTRAASKGEERLPEKLRKSSTREKEERRRVDKRERGNRRDRGPPVPEVRVQAPMNTDTPRRKPVPVRHERSPSARSIELDGGEDSAQHLPREVSPSAPSVGLVERQAPVEPPRSDTPREISPSTRSLDLDRRQSPIEPSCPDTGSLVETIGTSRASSPIMSQAPPPPPPPGNHPPPHKHASMVALLGDIKGGFKLRRVTNSEKKDTSMNPSGERVVYDETPHSRDVEDRERAQLAEESTADPANAKAEAPPDPNRAFQNDLMKALKRRSSRQVTEHECAPVGQRSTSESGENLIFTLAAHVARPDWSFDGLEMI
ncbi:hypothetical protein P3342_005204 [Pyrenophora teres f. teres]|nr:hypothetical protein P3342_005204 [Pyrenophora teres f. teres]